VEPRVSNTLIVALAILLTLAVAAFLAEGAVRWRRGRDERDIDAG
jgi:hypothetical protein